ncbi:Gfo/Idh/MocA family oxidoreductase [Arthrobacter rhombi]|uniref:Gfo/Idh/MocA family protein n=1 Tax=Arthrobacter rhombi TaxID=71253 RepID=UPI0031DB577C
MNQHPALRTAVIGFGLSGRVFHTPLIVADPAYSLEAIVTGNPERAAQASTLHPGAQILPDAEALFARADDFDVVVIGTPPDTHAELALAAIGHGLHVVVDKPFAISSRAGREVVDAAQQAGVVLSVFQNRRWDADFLTVSRLVADGALGAVHTFESRFERWKPAGLRAWKDTAGLAGGGGILFDLGTHVIDQALALFGPATSVYGETRRLSAGGSDADEDAFVAIRHASGVDSHLSLGLHFATPAPRFRVLGTEAGYEVWGMDGQEAALDGGASPTDPGYGQVPRDQWGSLGVPGALEPVPAATGDYPAFYRGFAAAAHGDGPLPVDPADAIAVLEIIEGIHASHRP